MKKTFKKDKDNIKKLLIIHFSTFIVCCIYMVAQIFIFNVDTDNIYMKMQLILLALYGIAQPIMLARYYLYKTIE